MYGFVDYCTAATLKVCAATLSYNAADEVRLLSSYLTRVCEQAKNGDMEVSNLVSTHELSITRGSIVHTLTARAMIRDW